MDEMKPEDAVAFVIAEDEDTGEVDLLVAELAESVRTASTASLKTELAQARAELQVAQLREEIKLLKHRLATFGGRAKATATAQTDYVSSSAHAQLGDYPWVKLAAATAAAWLAGRLVRW